VEVILQTIFEDPDRIYQALCLGATGYVLKNTPLPQLCQAIQDVAAGGSALSPSVARRMLAHFKPASNTYSAQLTPREQEVLRALVDGLSDKEIAQRLDLGTETVRGYVKTIYKKLQVTGRVELLSRAAKGQL
jgi:DNA-binding NarL/FixJ family response regulator